MTHLAIFDFDGTISQKDSFEDFIFFTHGVGGTWLGVIRNSLTLMAYLAKIIPNGQAKEKIFRYFYGGWEAAKFEMFAEHYIKNRLSRILRPAALEKIQWHKNQGHKVVVVSASFENYLRLWCQTQGVDLLATQLEIIDGKLTGKFASKNCYGDEKVRRVKEAFDLTAFTRITAYGDSKGDLPLKEIAHEFHYKPFR